MTAGGRNEYGDDSKSNRFTDPATGEEYFLIIDKKTGKTKIYNEEFLADKYIGEYDPDTGKIKYNNNWYGGARKEEREFFNNNKNLIKNQAKKVIIKEKKKEEGLSGLEAAKEANTLMKDSNLLDAESAVAIEGTGENYGTGTKEKAFVYPTTLRQIGNGQDTLKITMIEYRASGLDQETLKGANDRSEIKIPKVPKGTVILPIPGGINATNKTDWNSDELNAVDAATAQFILTTGNSGVGDAISEVQKKFDNAAMGDVKAALLAALASGAGKTNTLTSRNQGQVLNPNMELLFKGPSLRDFSFKWKLAPRNSKEAKVVLQIIRFFKQGMAPIRSEGTLFLKTPMTFELMYTHKGQEHKALNKFKECALAGCQVDYTPDATYNTYKDGIMTAYDMTLSFKELSPIYNDDYGPNKNGIPQEIGF